MKYYSITLGGLLLLTVFACARKCPSDKKIGNLDLSNTTRSFLPTVQQVQALSFTAENGRKRNFQNTNPDWEKRTELGVETLCERGDFLDKTVQVAYYDAEAYHLYYRSEDDSLSIGIDLMFSNALNTGQQADTAFYETVAISMFGQSTNISNGVLSILSADRGNANRIPMGAHEDIFRFVSDTSLAGRTLQNIYVTPAGNQRDIFIFYSKEKGMEAFEADGLLWLRD